MSQAHKLKGSTKKIEEKVRTRGMKVITALDKSLSGVQTELVTEINKRIETP